MTYLQKHTRSRFGGSLLKWSLVFVPIFIFILILNVSESSGRFFSNNFSSMFRVGGYFYENVSGFKNTFFNKSELISKNEELNLEIESLRLADIDYQSVAKENESLRKELGLKPISESLSGRIIARPPQIPLDSLYVDRGTEDSVKVGALVLVSDRVLVGRTSKVSSNGAMVALNSFPGLISYGSVERTSEPIEIVGIGGGGMQAKVPIDFDIELEDRIIVEGGLSYVAAIVGSVEENQSSGFKEVLLSLPADISKTHVVFIEPFAVNVSEVQN